MISVNGIPIMADANSILVELRNQLTINGIELLAKLKPTRNNVQFPCPSHGDGQEKKPSCGMSNVDVNRNGRVIPAGTVHCFSCGYTASIAEFVSFCFGRGLDGGSFGYRWLIKNFVSIEVDERKPIHLNIDRNSSKVEKVAKFISDSELEKYRFVHPYMYKRKLNDTIIQYFDIGYDVETKCITFPVKDRLGRTMFIQKRSVVGKFFNNAEDGRKSETLYGLDKVIENTDRINELIVCESIIDALTCWVHRRPAVALMGTGNEQQYEILKKLNIRKYILALDEDDAGFIGWQKLKKHLNNSQLLYKFILPSDKKDLNELTHDQFEELEEVLM